MTIRRAGVVPSRHAEVWFRGAPEGFRDILIQMELLVILCDEPRDNHTGVGSRDAYVSKNGYGLY